jgi:hypothetical protein
MKRLTLPLRVRVAYEPNRFSSESLVKVYEQLGPTPARAVSTRHETAGDVAKSQRPSATSGAKS